MSNQFSEYQDLYIQTSKEYLQELNTSLLKLEKDPLEKMAIEDIFRSAHSLKSQSAAMEFNSIAYLCHTIEDVFYEVKENRLKITPKLADILFKSFDSLTKAIAQIEKKNSEIDQESLIRELKKITGVTTKDGGKSTRQSPKTTAETTERTAEKTIAVKVRILDDLMNLVEELLINKNNYGVTQKILGSLQYKIMQARAVKVDLVFEHFPRAVRDLAKTENKEIELKIVGQDLELDKNIVDKLDEPLIHILRNAVSHGIEKKGLITITARNEKDYAVISVEDNGRGIDWEKLAQKMGKNWKEIPPQKLTELLFSGTSTAETVSEISGRGVGMKVVKKMITDFGGEIDVQSELQKGTKISLKLPLTLAVIKAVMVKVDQQDYAIPSLQIDRIINLKIGAVKETADWQAFVLEGMEIPLVALHNKQKITQDQIVVVVYAQSERLGLMVDTVSQAEDIVVKELPPALKEMKLFSGTTITGSGLPALIINTQGLL